MEPLDDFPTMQRSPTNSRAQTLEASASTVWSLLFMAYSSSTFISEFSTGWGGIWTLGLVVLPILLAGLPNVLEKRPNAVVLLLSYLAYVIVPSLLQLTKPAGLAASSAVASFIDAVTVAVIWVPLELRLLPRSFSPTGKVAWPLLIAATTIINTFTILTPFPPEHPLGYSYKLFPFDVASALAFTIPAIIVTTFSAVVLRFGKLRSKALSRPALTKNPSRQVAVFFGLYVSAVAEELLFRGLIFNIIILRTPTAPIIPVVASSVLFAIAHLSKKKLGFSAPNWRYAVCAFVMSLFCAMVYHLTAKVCASALTHAIINFTVYRTLLSDNIQS